MKHLDISLNDGGFMHEYDVINSDCLDVHWVCARCGEEYEEAPEDCCERKCFFRRYFRVYKIKTVEDEYINEDEYEYEKNDVKLENVSCKNKMESAKEFAVFAKMIEDIENKILPSEKAEWHKEGYKKAYIDMMSESLKIVWKYSAKDASPKGTKAPKNFETSSPSESLESNSVEERKPLDEFHHDLIDDIVEHFAEKVIHLSYVINDVPTEISKRIMPQLIKCLETAFDDD